MTPSRAWIIPISASIAAHAGAAAILVAASFPADAPPRLAIPDGEPVTLTVTLVEPAPVIQPIEAPPPAPEVALAPDPDPILESVPEPVAAAPDSIGDPFLPIARATRAAAHLLAGAHVDIAESVSHLSRLVASIPTPPSSPDLVEPVPVPIAEAPAPDPAPAIERGITDPPRALRTNLPPEYPEAARRRGHTGTVRVRATVETDGRVSDATVTDSCGHDALDAAALGAVRDWRFHPATIDGAPSRATIDIPIEFVLTARSR